MARTLYQKFRDIWKDKPDKTTPVTAEALNHIEQGIYDNSNKMALKEIYGDTAVSIGRKPSTTVGSHSVAIGDNVTADGSESQAFGIETIAHTFQNVIGRCNIPDTALKYVHIVGNGLNVKNRSNAHTLDWGGNAWFAGDVASDEADLDALGASLISTATDISNECTVNVDGQTLEITAPIDGVLVTSPYVGGCLIGFIMFQSVPAYIFRAQISHTFYPTAISKGIAKLLIATTDVSTFAAVIDGKIQDVSITQSSPSVKAMVKLSFELGFTSPIANFTIFKALPLNDLTSRIETLERRVAELEKEG